MGGHLGWVIGLVGIVILAASLFLLQRDWFEASRGRERRLSPAARRMFIGGIVLGLALFVAAMIVGPGR